VSSNSPGAALCAEGLGRARSTYARRRPEDTVLHRILREHLETFLAEARRRGGGALPGVASTMALAVPSHRHPALRIGPEYECPLPLSGSAGGIRQAGGRCAALRARAGTDHKSLPMVMAWIKVKAGNLLDTTDAEIAAVINPIL
jgi:hypothetical protein